MSLTPEQLFKIGFLYKCAQAGLTQEETHEVVKEAISRLKGESKQAQFGTGLISGAGKVVGSATSALPHLFSLGGLALMGIPVAAGAVGGYSLAKLRGGGDAKTMLEDAKKDEIVGEYERLAEEARRRARLKRLQSMTGERVVALTPST